MLSSHQERCTQILADAHKYFINRLEKHDSRKKVEVSIMREKYIELIIEYISKEYDEDLLCSIYTFTKYTVTEQREEV